MIDGANKLPPYGRNVVNNPRNVFIYAGRDAWSSGRTRANLVGKNSVMVLPPGEDFRAYRWPVKGLSLMLVWPDGSLSDVQAFGEHLVRAGAALVVAPHHEDSENALFIKPVRIAA
jgi:hypothetical protein